MSETVAIGIDLGTTNTVAAVMKSDGIVEIIPTPQGNRTMPSYVAYTNTETLVGTPAQRQASSNRVNTIYDVKRMMGQIYKDESIQSHLKNWPFEIIDVEGFPRYKVNVKNEEKFVSPEQISAEILAEVRKYAGLALAKSVTHVVITVPAYFNNSQREATKEAAELAGLQVLRIINEPTAAALAYGMSIDKQGKKNVLIFDVGGGTLDVTILTIKGDCFNVLATAGNMHLGGQDFNNALLTYLMDKFRSEKGCDMSKNPRAVERLRRECEDAKLQLSYSTTATIQLDELFNGHDFYITISRDELEKVCEHFFNAAIKCVEKAMEDAHLNHTQLHDVILVGCSSRIPKIQEMLKATLKRTSLSHTIHADEAVAQGAAIQAAVLEGLAKNIVLIDIIPLSLGISIREGELSVIIKRNTAKPCDIMKIYTTCYDNQQSVSIEVYEGERPMVKDNHYLGKFILRNIPKAKRGVPQILVTFSVDNNGILQVTAQERTMENGKSMIVSKDKRVPETKIQKFLEETEQKKLEDDAQVRNAYKANCRKRIVDEKDDAIKAKYQKFLNWLDENADEDIMVIKSEYEKLRTDDEPLIVLEETANKLDDAQVRNAYKANCRKRIVDEKDDAIKAKYQKLLNWLDENADEDIMVIKSEYEKLWTDDEPLTVLEETANKLEDDAQVRNAYKANCRKRIVDEKDDAIKAKYQKFLNWLDENADEDIMVIKSEYEKLGTDDEPQ